METKFTPGPWKIASCESMGTIMVCTDGDTICFGDPNHKEPDDTANFRLIASAPELYEAGADAEDALASLEKCLQECGPAVSAKEAYDSFYSGNVRDALEALRAALKKARGES